MTEPPLNRVEVNIGLRTMMLAVAVLIGSLILGVVGAILAVPFAAVIKTVLREAGQPRRERMATARAAGQT